MTNIKLITSNLKEELIQGIEKASSIYILTSFVMRSGVQVLKESLKKAVDRGADVKVCTGDYLFITQPDALRELIAIDERIEVRLWESKGVSFHPKAYILQFQEEGSLIVGSSNLSRSALTTGIEWNIGMDQSIERDTFQEALDQFTKIFYHPQTITVNIETIKSYEKDYDEYHQTYPNLVKKWTEREEIELTLPNTAEVETVEGEFVKETAAPYVEIQPRFAQIDALEELNTTLEEGYSSAMVVMATGLGKTYLAAFFAKSFKRILFIAHREEILHQARESFKLILPDKVYGIYNGKEKDGEADTVFASIYTLSMKRHLEFFNPTDFDLIIIDEFHHAAANSYQRVLEYFEPSFLLGITATPDRNDNRDVYAICDGNIAYRIDFLEAIQHQWLAPFKYYGVYDDTDYSQITWLGNRYAEEELLQIQLREEIAERVVKAWNKHKQTRTIVFCSSIKQAIFLSDYFNTKGYKTVSLHSKQIEVGRADAIKLLSKGELDAIFTVDLFNEGVDIPLVDTLLFVRPTESLTVFTQQVGRGLRLHPEKSHCVIIDLIGNYRNADLKLSLFDTSDKDRKKKVSEIQPEVPIGCFIDLETQVVNLLEEMARKRQPRKQQLYDSYFKVKQELGRRPRYLDLHLKGIADTSQYKQEFSSYIGFLSWAEELTDAENEVYKKYNDWFIEAERTSMSKSYKMIVLLAMLDRGHQDWYKPITPEEVAPSFHNYLTEKEYRKRIDFSDAGSKKLWEYNEEKVSKLITAMPMTKWSGSSKGIVKFVDNQFWIDLGDVTVEDQEILFKWTQEICEYRLHQHFERKSN